MGWGGSRFFLDQAGQPQKFSSQKITYVPGVPCQKIYRVFVLFLNYFDPSQLFCLETLKPIYFT